MAWPVNPKAPTKTEAQERLNKMLKDPSSPYLNLNGKATPEERKQAVNLANQLREIVGGKRVWLDTELS